MSITRARHPLFFAVCAFMVCCFCSRLTAQEKSKPEGNAFMEKIGTAMDGFEVGDDTNIFPYVTLGSFFDVYGGLLISHPVPWNSDRVLHSIKFENFSEYAWKLKYLANSLSSERMQTAFVVKLKSDEDDYYYGVGAATLWRNRERATYRSVFAGAEWTYHLSEALNLQFSPGYWHFRSGLESGGEFERASDAQYITTRFTLLDAHPVDYLSPKLQNQWHLYLETGVPVSSAVASYARLSYETLTRIPVYHGTKLGVGTRIETLFSPNREMVPFYALPEAGRRSGLNGYSKNRFHDFSIAVVNFEYAIPLKRNFEVYLLSDLGRVASEPQKLLSSKLYSDFGMGLRLIHGDVPVSAGIATGSEGVKLFTNIALGLP